MCWVQTGHPPLSPASGTRGLHPWVPRDCNNQKHSFRRLPPPGYCIDSRLKSTLCFSGKKKLFIPESPAKSQKFKFATLGLQKCSGKESKPNNAILHSQPHNSLPGPPKKELVHSSGSFIFWTDTQGIPADYLVWKAAGLRSQSHRTVQEVQKVPNKMN